MAFHGLRKRRMSKVSNLCARLSDVRVLRNGHGGPSSLDFELIIALSVLRTASHLIPLVGKPSQKRSACSTMCIT